MHYFNPTAAQNHAVETSATPNNGALADTQHAMFGALAQSDLRQLVAAMVD